MSKHSSREYYSLELCFDMYYSLELCCDMHYSLELCCDMHYSLELCCDIPFNWINKTHNWDFIYSYNCSNYWTRTLSVHARTISVCVFHYQWCILFRYVLIYRVTCRNHCPEQEFTYPQSLNLIAICHQPSSDKIHHYHVYCTTLTLCTIDFCFLLSIHWVLLGESELVINSLTCTWIYFLKFNLTSRHIEDCLRVTVVKYGSLMMSLGRWYLAEEQLVTCVFTSRCGTMGSASDSSSVDTCQ